MLTMFVEYVVDFIYVPFQKCFVRYVPIVRWHGDFVDDVLHDSVVSGACAVLLPCASLTGTDEQQNIECGMCYRLK